ncbi:hypothetical protein JQ633_01175 [Bradyrhizobium tropiciagri]|uniref:hypothetical protein n=1 Tax=Bradyrhizobium tropiciagri TaxID=312253 RepID=UPI001BA5F95F|nr:hypothetical protein [Bradyrhizobium tropiciagri]MBR0868953.1 hypothetical protein [Bradyrhizobium tropiciagri]
MSLKSSRPRLHPPKPPKDTERDMRSAVVKDADKSEDKDRDLVHGEGGTLGLDDGDDLNRDD